MILIKCLEVGPGHQDFLKHTGGVRSSAHAFGGSGESQGLYTGIDYVWCVQQVSESSIKCGKRIRCTLNFIEKTRGRVLFLLRGLKNVSSLWCTSTYWVFPLSSLAFKISFNLEKTANQKNTQRFERLQWRWTAISSNGPLSGSMSIFTLIMLTHSDLVTAKSERTPNVLGLGNAPF